MILTWIILAGLLGGLLSILFAAFLTLKTSSAWVSTLVSYAIGAMLGAAFINTLPEALAMADDSRSITIIILLGILAFFILEKLVLWRHCHLDECEVHDINQHAMVNIQHDHGRSGIHPEGHGNEDGHCVHHPQAGENSGDRSDEYAQQTV